MPNRLQHESSPYLLAHADNPVDWYPWGPQALALARETGRPILLSIGYSACHWCHVMAHECFEDAEVADVMNRLYVNIKVDREERPDLDRIYQQAFQLLNQRGGGWPLTMFLTHDDQVPFFGATYVPKQARHGMPGLIDLLERLAEVCRSRPEEVRQQNAALLQALAAGPSRVARTGYSLNPGPLATVRSELAQAFDRRFGGFGGAPKFPHTLQLERLLRQAAAGDDESGAMLAQTLTAMARGGLRDHLDGGFFRYCVDAQWGIPHFEKMLYDNGPLLALYAQAWELTGNPLYREVVESTAGWAIARMQSAEGGFFSALDADSDGQEGAFYRWDAEEVRTLLADDAPLFAAAYGLDEAPNFEGRWHHLVRRRDAADLARAFGLPESEVRDRIATARTRLAAQREQRIAPARDEKILCAWNALMIQGLAVAGHLLHREDWIDAAARAMGFVRERLWRDGRLLACYAGGEARLPAYLDDYAFLIEAALDLCQARWDDGTLRFSLDLTEVVLERFQDTRRGGFHFTADDHERLIVRPKPLFDETLPSANGVMAHNLLRLGRLLGHMPWLVAAEKTLKWAWPSLERNPMACSALLRALDEYFNAGQTVILRHTDGDIRPWRGALARYRPGRLCLVIPPGAGDLPAALGEKRPPRSGTRAWVCEGTTCSAPVDEPSRLAALLGDGPAGAGSA